MVFLYGRLELVEAVDEKGRVLQHLVGLNYSDEGLNDIFF